jgi:hypothetical protein
LANTNDPFCYVLKFVFRTRKLSNNNNNNNQQQLQQ